jgi:hypothetical protein
MTKEDYMRLPKARLAELLAERDALEERFRGIPLQTWQHPCSDPSWPCINPQHDCVNCPRTNVCYKYTITDHTEWAGIDVKDIFNDLNGE